MAVTPAEKAPAAPAAVSLADKMKAAKARATGSTKKPRPQEYSLNAEGDDPVKLMLFGSIGSGKSFFIVGMLLEGERVFVLSTDFGGNGLVSVKNELKRLGRLDLLKNLRGVDLATYEDLADFWDAPLEFAPTILEFDPTVFMWEGASAFNIDMLDEYILTMAPGAEKSGELRHAGFTHTTQDWQGMKRGTMRQFRRAISFTLPNGKRMHKIVTAHESKMQNNELTNRTEKGPLIQGSARDLIGGGFDVVLQCLKEEKGEDIVYKYRAVGASDKLAVKNRGFAIKGVMEADPQKVWRILTNKDPVQAV
jgi:hypothetical protein